MPKSSKGFTIIELVVVVAIILVLAAIVIINVTTYVRKSKLSAIEGDLHTMINYADLYYTTNGFFGDVPNGRGFCSSPDGLKMQATINKISGFGTECLDASTDNCTSDQFVFVSMSLNEHNYPVTIDYCVDHTGSYTIDLPHDAEQAIINANCACNAPDS